MRTLCVMGFVSLLIFSSLAHARDFDVPALCRQTAESTERTVFADYFHGWPGMAWEASGHDIATAIASRDAFWYGVYPWLLAESPEINHREGAYWLQIEKAKQFLAYAHVSQSLDEVLTQFSETQVPYSAKALTEHDTYLKKYLALPLMWNDSVTTDSSKVCDVYLFPRCKESLARVNALMSSRVIQTGATTSLPGVMTELYSSAIYRQALAKLSLSLMKKVVDKDSSGSIDTEATAAFMASGMTLKSAQLAALAVLGYIGTRGPSIAGLYRFTNSESYPVHVSLLIISSAIELLNIYAQADGRNFAYPSAVEGSCDNGRSYHFWLSAYLSEKLKEEGYPIETAFMATHLMGVGYEVLSSLFKDQTQIYYGPLLNAYDINTQENITYDDAGAAYGVLRNSPLGNVADLESSLSEMFSGARPMPALSADEVTEGLKDPIKQYLWFHQVIAPDQNLPYFLLRVMGDPFVQ